MVSKWIKVQKYYWGTGGQVEIFNKVIFYAGTREYWGVGLDISFYDRSISFNILNLYFGVEVWRKDKAIVELLLRSKGDLLD
ncbi:MAG: hypothetical protein EBS31_00435 [Burkholderiaceae bacterium]|nr:hypothetical protein [Burkholderiaceae bacterium]